MIPASVKDIRPIWQNSEPNFSWADYNNFDVDSFGNHLVVRPRAFDYGRESIFPNYPLSCLVYPLNLVAPVKSVQESDKNNFISFTKDGLLSEVLSATIVSTVSFALKSNSARWDAQFKWINHLDNQVDSGHTVASNDIFTLHGILKSWTREKESFRKEFDAIYEGLGSESEKEALKEKFNSVLNRCNRFFRTAEGVLKKVNSQSELTDLRRSFRKKTNNIFKSLDDEDVNS